MTSGYTQVFGGQNINPAALSYREIALTENIVLVWPNLAQAGADVVAEKMDVTPDAGSRSITMPDATQVTPGVDTLFNNVGSYTFTVLDADGNTLASVASGAAWYLYLTDNTTAAGEWRVVQFGAGSSSAQASSLAGLGLVAAATLLNQSHPISTKNANYTLMANDRAQMIISTGGAITFAFTAAATLGNNWFAMIRNDGSGNLTLNPNGSEPIDDAATKVLAPTESCFVVCDSTAFFTVGYGRSITSTITAVTIDGSGAAGDQTLTAIEVAATIEQFTGTITGDRNYEYGTVVGFWIIQNDITLDSHLATWRVDNADAGVTSADVGTGTRAIIFSNGTNMFLALSSAGGTVTSVATGTGLTGGPITTNGTISMANTAVTPGAYTFAGITVDAQGRLTAAASGSVPSPTITLTGDVTAGPGTSPLATTIATDAVVTATILNANVTLAKIQNIATNSLIGRDTAGTGVPETILLDDTLEMDGSGNLQRAALTGDVTAAAGGNATTIGAGKVLAAMLKAAIIPDFTGATPDVLDSFIFSDVSDSGNTKKALLSDLVAIIVPLVGGVQTGTMLDFGADTLPSVGYLACDGANVSRTTYAALFAVVSTTWGVGNGTTTFGLPDSRRRTGVGKGGTGTAELANTVGSIGGAETDTLTIAKIPSHTHAESTGFDTGGGGNPAWDTSGLNFLLPLTSATGGGGSHNNIQPSYVVTKMIKT